MTKPLVKHDAEMFAQGFAKGREAKVEHMEAAARKRETRVRYLEKRITKLAKDLAAERSKAKPGSEPK